MDRFASWVERHDAYSAALGEQKSEKVATGGRLIEMFDTEIQTTRQQSEKTTDEMTSKQESIGESRRREAKQKEAIECLEREVQTKKAAVIAKQRDRISLTSQIESLALKKRSFEALEARLQSSTEKDAGERSKLEAKCTDATKKMDEVNVLLEKARQESPASKEPGPTNAHRDDAICKVMNELEALEAEQEALKGTQVSCHPCIRMIERWT